jgi:hypothetical protein
MGWIEDEEAYVGAGDEHRSNSSLQVRQQHILDKGHCGEPRANESGRANREVNTRYCRTWSL